jgi:hypothetical protein
MLVAGLGDFGEGHEKFIGLRKTALENALHWLENLWTSFMRLTCCSISVITRDESPPCDE